MCLTAVRQMCHNGGPSQNRECRPVEEYGFLNITKLMHCGVYALVKKGEVVYVGKSKQPLMRIYTHVKNRGRKMGANIYSKEDCGPAVNGKGISFDSAWFLPCMLGQLWTLEVHFIKMFMPKHNVRHNPEARSRPEREPTQIMSIPEDMKELLRQIVVITDLPPMEPTAPRGPYIMRRL